MPPYHLSPGFMPLILSTGPQAPPSGWLRSMLWSLTWDWPDSSHLACHPRPASQEACSFLGCSASQKQGTGYSVAFSDLTAPSGMLISPSWPLTHHAGLLHQMCMENRTSAWDSPQYPWPTACWTCMGDFDLLLKGGGGGQWKSLQSQIVVTGAVWAHNSL